MVLTSKKRDVRRPQVLCARAFLLDPVGYVVKNVAAPFPLVQILRAADGNLSICLPPGGGAEQVPGLALLN